MTTQQTINNNSINNCYIVISNEYVYKKSERMNLEYDEIAEDIIIKAMKKYRNFNLPVNKKIFSIYTVTPTEDYYGYWHIFIEDQNKYIQLTHNIYTYFDLNIIQSMLLKYIGNNYQIISSIANINEKLFKNESTYNIYKFDLNDDMYYTELISATFRNYSS